ncbi:MAG TPA: hypothetical protein VFG69_12620, partial [Nannocystaceae bacterium]|nr:hypothetical protein [Nannocystaceae bacterium]
ARACPGCGFPIAEHLAEQAQKAALEEDRVSRARIGEVDCVRCEARGFYPFLLTEGGTTRESFEWCRICEHTGRVDLCRGRRGYYAVARLALETFLAGTRDDGDELVVFLGTAEPPPHRFAKAGDRYPEET